MPQPVHSERPPQDAEVTPSQAPRGSWGRGPTATPQGPSAWKHGRSAVRTCSARHTDCWKPCLSRRSCPHRVILAWLGHWHRLLQRQHLAPSTWTSRWPSCPPELRRARGKRRRRSPTARAAACRSGHGPRSARVHASSLRHWQRQHKHAPNAWCAGEPCEEGCGDGHRRTLRKLLMESVLAKWFREF